jgi:putative acetyltransferase
MPTSAEFIIRPMRANDNAAVLSVIQQCVLEFGYTHSPYVTHPEEEGDIHGCFTVAHSGGYVIEDENGNIVGSGGYAPLHNNNAVCEIQKVYFLPRVRGKGMGRKLVERLMDEAAPHGFREFYLETVPEMITAVTLYEKLGFSPCQRKSADGHNCCSVFMHRAV